MDKELVTFFEEDPKGMPSLELLEYTGQHPEIAPAQIIELPHIPVLIGGMKSDRFIIKDPEESPDASPEDGYAVDMSETRVAASGLQSFADAFHSAEHQADAQYSAALFETQQHIAQTQSPGREVLTLFVPGVVNETAHDYFCRLQRLSQDTGLAVATYVSMGEDGSFFNEYAPPQASSIDAYWKVRSEKVMHRKYEPYVPTLQEGRELVSHLYAYGVSRGDARPENVRPLSSMRAEDLCILFDERGSNAHDEVQAARQNIKTAAYELKDHEIRDYHKAAARKILAKLNDPEGLPILQHELDTKTGGYGDHTLLYEPLGIYMSHDKELLTKTIRTVKEMLDGGCEEGPYAPIHLMSALRYSMDPVVGPVMSKYLRQPKGEEMISIFRCLPGYLEDLQALPRTSERQASLDVIEKDVARYLAEVTNIREQRISQGIPETGDGLVLADMLFGFGDQGHQDVLRRHVLALFAERGSVVENNSNNFLARDFPRDYIRYREMYGDLPEISRHIRIVSHDES